MRGQPFDTIDTICPVRAAVMLDLQTGHLAGRRDSNPSAGPSQPAPPSSGAQDLQRFDVNLRRFEKVLLDLTADPQPGLVRDRCRREQLVVELDADLRLAVEKDVLVAADLADQKALQADLLIVGRGLEHLGWATIITARNAVEARVLVTERIPPLTVQGQRLHQIGLPYHWGWAGYSTGDSANDLVEVSLDPNVHIQEGKAFACDIRPGRRPTGAARPALVRAYRERAGITERTGTAP